MFENSKVLGKNSSLWLHFCHSFATILCVCSPFCRDDRWHSHHLVALIPLNTKKPFKGLRSLKTHAAKRAPLTIEQPGVVTHSNVCPCTAVKHSRGKLWSIKRQFEDESRAERMEQKPGAQHICLSPAAHPPWFVLHIGAVPTTYDNILVSAGSEEHRGGHIPRVKWFWWRKLAWAEKSDRQ